MAAWRYKISLLVLKKYFITRREISYLCRPCNILYIYYINTNETEYIADSIKVALGIRTLLFGAVVTQVNHCIVPYARKTNITKATFFDLAVYQVSFRVKT